jgi:hypothetical protein
MRIVVSSGGHSGARHDLAARMSGRWSLRHARAGEGVAGSCASQCGQASGVVWVAAA